MEATPWKFESSSGHQCCSKTVLCMTRVLNKKLKKSSKKWMQRQVNDPYVEQAKQEGYRSRAAYKLLEMQRKFKLANKDSVVLDLGAAPGGWSQVMSEIARDVIAIDLLDMAQLPNVEFIKGDFTDNNVIRELNQLLQNQKVDVILSDMAPNTCGIKQVDHLRIIELVEMAYDFCHVALKPGGNFVAKVFQGGTCSELLDKIKKHFVSVKHFKPLASRKESSEIYLVAIGYRL